MREFFQVLKEILFNEKLKELRSRIRYTIFMLMVFRLGTFIVLPGIDSTQLINKENEGIFGLLNTFLGGAFSRTSVFGLGIIPYISASIAIQLLSFTLPYFQKLQKEGASGRNQLKQITRFLTIAITLIQSIGYLSSTINSEIILIPKFTFMLSSTIILTTGTVFCMWIGEKITDKGIGGNGVSLLLMVGIVSSLPRAIATEIISKQMKGSLLIILTECIILFGILMLVILFITAIREIPIQYANQMLATNSLYTQKRKTLPLKVDSVGIMPIIFAQALMFLPVVLTRFCTPNSKIYNFLYLFADFTTWTYNITFFILIMLFTFFYTIITINTNQMADDMKRNNAFISGIQPGKATALFIDNLLLKLTLPGSIFLATIAILPVIAYQAGITKQFSQFYGGSSSLIMISVAIEMMQQIKTQLIIPRYDTINQSI